ncbi:hypothetical protein [Clostridium butyricum]
MVKEKTKVKLYEVDKLKEDFKQIEIYTKFISEKLKDIINNKEIYKEDLQECINIVNKINSYVQDMQTNKNYYDVRLELVDWFDDYLEFETLNCNKKCVGLRESKFKL